MAFVPLRNLPHLILFLALAASTTLPELFTLEYVHNTLEYPYPCLLLAPQK